MKYRVELQDMRKIFKTVLADSPHQAAAMAREDNLIPRVITSLGDNDEELEDFWFDRFCAHCGRAIIELEDDVRAPDHSSALCELCNLERAKRIWDAPGNLPDGYYKWTGDTLLRQTGAALGLWTILAVSPEHAKLLWDDFIVPPTIGSYCVLNARGELLIPPLPNPADEPPAT